MCGDIIENSRIRKNRDGEECYDLMERYRRTITGDPCILGNTCFERFVEQRERSAGILFDR
jgi:hypothetical protein